MNGTLICTVEHLNFTR